MDQDRSAPFRRFQDWRWEGVAHLPYKEDGAAPFKSVTRQVLFHEPDMGCELRYFEVAPGGHSTLERHEHAHAVLILRGRGEAMVGGDIRPLATNDLVSIPPWAWHQFRATAGEPLGFLCMVNALRDRPQLPTEDELAALRAVPDVAAFLDRTGTTP
jgi:mannose-6-phosphate isomerase-like protein (cupin superfamily)